MRANCIVWDDEFMGENLPDSVELPEWLESEDEVADYLSDEYGWCVESFVLDY